jgi:hypothetical protein
MKYLCLAYGSEKDWNALSKREQDELLAQDEVIRQRGNTVAAVESTATIVRAWDGVPKTDGHSIANAQIPLAGFAIIEAADEEQVIELVADTPCARAHGAIEVRPIMHINDASDDTLEREPKLGPEHARLNVFVGAWRVTGRNGAGADRASNLTVVGEERYEWLPGNYFLTSSFDRHFDDGTRHMGSGTFRFDAATGQYLLYLFDNLGFARRYTVTVDGHRWTYDGAHERALAVFSDEDKRMTVDWEVRNGDSKWVPLCHLEATRVE